MNTPPRASLRRWIFAAILLPGLAAILPVHSAEAATETPANNAAPVINEAQVAEHYREVLARPEFQDTGETALDTRLEDWFTQWFKRLGEKMGNFKYANQMPAFESLLMTLLVVFSISVLFYILFRLKLRRGRMEKEPPDGSPGPKTFRPPEFYDEEIKQALATGDWHEAWLAAWRQFLSRLENRNLVDADRTRTNREYLAQLREQPLPDSALALLNAMVDAYDRSIYGRAVIGPAEWNAFHRHIDEAALLLHLDDKRATSRINREVS
jgi:hypothetical protein